MPLAACAILLGCSASAGQTASVTACNRALEMKAQDRIDHLDTWSAIYEASRRLAACDDGSVGEGFSDSIVHHLASDWTSLVSTGVQD